MCPDQPLPQRYLLQRALSFLQATAPSHWRRYVDDTWVIKIKILHRTKKLSKPPYEAHKEECHAWPTWIVWCTLERKPWHEMFSHILLNVLVVSTGVNLPAWECVKSLLVVNWPLSNSNCDKQLNNRLRQKEEGMQQHSPSTSVSFNRRAWNLYLLTTATYWLFWMANTALYVEVISVRYRCNEFWGDDG